VFVAGKLQQVVPGMGWKETTAAAAPPSSAKKLAYSARIEASTAAVYTLRSVEQEWHCFLAKSLSFLAN
jgi:hypothetical protein